MNFNIFIKNCFIKHWTYTNHLVYPIYLNVINFYYLQCFGNKRKFLSSLYFLERFKDKNTHNFLLNGSLSGLVICEKLSFDENYRSTCLSIVNFIIFHCLIPLQFKLGRKSYKDSIL